MVKYEARIPLPMSMKEYEKGYTYSYTLAAREGNKKGDGAFLACEDRECKVTGDESAWTASGRRRERELAKLKKAMTEKSIH